jgi:phosphoribosyl-AMP cyclohydrolase
MDTASLTDALNWNEQGLVPAIAQDWTSGEVLMLAWMNREALACTIEEGRAVYWSRSRKSLWRKGEESGNVQRLKELRVDCDADTVLLKVEQIGGVACHTGRRHCFFTRLEDRHWQVTEAVERDPEEMYGSPDE